MPIFPDFLKPTQGQPGTDDVQLKKDRIAALHQHPNFEFSHFDLANCADTRHVFAKQQIHRVIHLAAQAGVRYSLINPQAYVHSNVVAFTNVLEMCRHHSVEHLVYASSSSVYGANKKMPFSTHDNVDHPISLYAATKKANELMAHTYSHLFQLPTTGLRFFTVYGPWGRPDMAMFLFTKAIFSGKAIDVFNYGKMQRDFTYIDDIAEGVVQVADNIPDGTSSSESPNADELVGRAHYRLYNIGNNRPVELMYLIEVLESCIGKKAYKNMLPLQPGDVLPLLRTLTISCAIRASNRKRLSRWASSTSSTGTGSTIRCPLLHDRGTDARSRLVLEHLSNVDPSGSKRHSACHAAEFAESEDPPSAAHSCSRQRAGLVYF